MTSQMQTQNIQLTTTQTMLVLNLDYMCKELFNLCGI